VAAVAVAVGADAHGTFRSLPIPNPHPLVHLLYCCTAVLQLAEQTERGASKSSYLCKYRAHATASLWAPTWELR
jgi:hypothetical protein